MKKITVQKKVRVITLLTALFSPILAGAGTSDKVASWFDDMNYSNVTSGGVYEGQSARYATLGGISTRAPITQPFQFVNVQTPKFSAGCGGIDLYSGGFSAIDADQFVENLRAIGQNAQSLAFMLAIQIVSPQLSGVMEDINGWAQKINSLNMSSCEAATAMMGGAMDLMGAQEGNCTLKRMQTAGETWSDANYYCTTGGKRKSTDAAGDPNFIDFVKGNLTWYVLMQDPFFQADTEFSEVVMNMTGTMLITDAGSGDDSPSNVVTLPPAITDEVNRDRFQNIYTALLVGSDAVDQLKIYQCQGGAVADKEACATLTSNMQTVTPGWQGLYNRVDALVSSIQSKIYTDTPLTNEEIGLISSTSIPLYRYLAASAAYFPRGTGSAHAREYTQLIAEDILLRALKGVIEKVEQRAAMLDGGMSESERLKDYRDNLEKVMSGLAKLRERTDFDMEQYFVMQQRIQMYEKAVMSRLGSGYITAAKWGH